MTDAAAQARRWLKRQAAAVYGWAGGWGPLRLRTGEFLAVAFHRITGSGDPRTGLRSLVNTDAETFGRMLDMLMRRFRIIAGEEFLTALAGRAALPPRSLLLTFDDGYRDFVTTALPQLRARRLPCLLFPTTAGLAQPPRLLWFDHLAWAVEAHVVPEWLLRGRNRWEVEDSEALAVRLVMQLLDGPIERLRRLEAELAERLPPEDAARRAVTLYLNADDLRQLDETVLVGSHGLTHQTLCCLSAGEAAAELGDSKALLEAACGRPVPMFAYPVGRPEDIPVEADLWLAAHGYTVGWTMQSGRNVIGSASSRYRLRRVAAGHSVEELQYHLLRALVSRP